MTEALFNYQAEGAAWLAPRRFGYLADEQGLGKTAQAIRAADLAWAERVCVVCPASAVENWRREIQRWSLGFWEADVLSYDGAVRRGLPAADTYVIDEAHFLKTASTKRTKRCLGVGSPLRDAARVWALSGTPAPNHVGELFTWLTFMGAARDMSYRQYLDRYTHWQMTDYGPKVWKNRADAMPDLKARMDRVFLRRLKSQVLKDLPPVRWGDITLSGKSEGHFDKVLADHIELSDSLPVEDEHIARLRREIGELKAPALAAYLADELDGSEGKLVVFAWHKAVLDVLEHRLQGFGVARIDGSVPAAKRQGEVDRFQGDANCRVFLGNIAAAGTAITLTAASNLVFAELAWTPGDNAQAAMRVHRIGQSQPVLIRTATLKGSIDEAVNQVLARKTRALDEVLGGAA